MVRQFVNTFLAPQSSAETFSTGEYVQAKIRIVISCVVFVYLTIRLWMTSSSALLSTLAFQIPLGFFVFSCFMLAWSKRLSRPYASQQQKVYCRIIGILVDLGVTSWGLAIMGPMGSPGYPIYLWVILGNGIRYGVNYLYGAMIVGSAGFTFVLYCNEYWHANTALGIGLLIGILTLPLYLSKLLKRLNESLIAAQQANRSKSRFIANISHELRTPLNSVIAISDLMAERPQDEETRTLVTMVQTSAKAQLGLINQLLEISKIESDNITLQHKPFDLYELISETANIIWPQARAKNLHLYTYIDSKVPYPLIGSPDHLRQVLLNLCSNSTKFTNAGRVDLRVWCKAEYLRTVSLRFEVSDSGIGIPDNARDRIFQPFTQADDSITRCYGGTGLGTTISKQLVELMGGRIECDSIEGVGTTFIVDVDFNKASHEDSFDQSRELNFLALGCSDLQDRLAQCCDSQTVRIDYSYDQEETAALYTRANPYHALLINVSHYGRYAAGLAQRLSSACIKGIPIIGLGRAEHVTLLADAGYSMLVEPKNNVELCRVCHLVSRYAPGQFDSMGSLTNPAQQLYILVADDQITNQKVVRMILEGAGHRIDTVDNGEKALHALEENQYDLAILDMHMPTMSGIEAASLYGFAHPREPIPIVILTADVTEQAVEQSKAAGVYKYLTKPIRPKELLRVIYGSVSSPTHASAQERCNRSYQKQKDPEIRENITPGRYRAAPESNLLDKTKLAELESISTKGRKFVVEVLEGFVRDGDVLVERLNQSLASGEYETTLDHAHALRGCAVSVGATAIYTSSAELDKLKFSQVAAEGPAILAKLTKDWVITRKACKQFIARAHSHH